MDRGPPTHVVQGVERPAVGCGLGCVSRSITGTESSTAAGSASSGPRVEGGNAETGNRGDVEGE